MDSTEAGVHAARCGFVLFLSYFLFCAIFKQVFRYKARHAHIRWKIRHISQRDIFCLDSTEPFYKAFYFSFIQITIYLLPHLLSFCDKKFTQMKDLLSSKYFMIILCNYDPCLLLYLNIVCPHVVNLLFILPAIRHHG